MSVVSMSAANGPLTAGEQAALDRIAAIPEEEIDCSDIPEVTDFSGWRRGRFSRRSAESTSGEAVTVHLDAETLAWFRHRANNPADLEAALAAALRDHVAQAQPAP